MSDCSVFYYVNGDPLDGEWIDLDDISSIEDVLQVLADTEHIPTDAEGNPDYGGDLLVADYEGDLASIFYSEGGQFDLEGCLEVLQSSVDEEIAVAYIDEFGQWDERSCLNNYYGKFENEERFCEHYLEQSGLLSGISDNLKYYFDFERFAKHELLINDFCESSGHYFFNHIF